MREVGVDGLIAARELGVPIFSQCERRLLDVECDLTNCVTTLEAVEWAICELRRMELQERYSFRGAGIGRDDEAGTSGAPLGRAEGNSGGSPKRSRCNSGNDDEDATAAMGGTHSAAEQGESLDDEEEPIKKGEVDREAAPSGGGPEQQQHPQAGGGAERKWRQLFKATGKRKSEDLEDSGSDEGGKRTKASELSKESESDDQNGEAGRRMAERITARLAVPECLFVTNLVSHCLLVSMDQVPPRDIQEVLAAIRLDDSAAPARKLELDRHHHQGSSEGDGGVSNDWLWLHKWLVKTVLSDIGNDHSFASLDWLIAFMTGARQSLIKPILVDLASDLERGESKPGSVNLASYIRRAGVLEYAALRDPERIFGSLRPLFPPTVFPGAAAEVEEDDDEGRWSQRMMNNELWHGWLGLMVLCPRLFAAFSRFWIPTLTVDEVQSWRVKSTSSLSEISSALMGTATEGTKTTRGWLHAAMMRRLPELAPVAYDLVVLLSNLDEASIENGASEDVLGFGEYALTSIYKELSKRLLPKVLGAGRDFSNPDMLPDWEMPKEDSGIESFMANLKQHAHVFWTKALESYSTSKCACCEIPHKEEMQLESSGRTRADQRDGSMCVDSSSGEGSAALKATNCGDGFGEIQKGCLFKDPLIQLCQLTLLCCPDQVVADLLVNASLVQPSSSAGGSFAPQSLRKLVMAMRAIWFVSGQGRGTLILELWAQQMIDRALAASDEQALHRILAIGQLLECEFWQTYQILLGPPSEVATATDAIEAFSEEDGRAQQQGGSSWKVVWKGLHKVLDVQWLQILPLMHREGDWELRLAVLTVLRLLNPDGTVRPQAVADRLKGLLGLFFSWLEVYDGCDENVVVGQVGKTARHMLERKSTWQCALAKEHLKSIIIELASSSFPSFTLMINSLLDFSFEHSKQLLLASSPLSSTGQQSLRKAGTGHPSPSFGMAPLSSGKLDRYGRLELVCGPLTSARGIGTASLRMADLQFTEENCKIQSDTSSPLQPYEKLRVLGSSHLKHIVSSHNATSESASSEHHLNAGLKRRSKVLDAEVANLLHRTFLRAKAKSVEFLDEWPCHPANVLATHLADRLETPHEVSMTMEQYEEVLPKHISSLRHIFLTDCFTQNPLLMEMVELIVSHGGTRAVVRCVEFVRVLLADSIARWHGTYRTRCPPCVSQQMKVGEMETWNRLQVSRLIQLVASANWLPQSLAASGEVVAVIDGVDIADLLLLVWRCMHHAIAFGSKSWGSSSSKLQAPPSASVEGQVTTAATGSGVAVDEEVGKEGTYTEWESHFFAILRRNVSKVGAHFLQLYPAPKAF